MKVHVLQHTKDTPAGEATDWLNQRGYPYTITRFFADEPLPDPADIDWLILCGGGMGVHDTRDFPWLIEEKKFIEKSIAHGSAALGLCLGAQLLAEIHGGQVSRHNEWEVGWHPVRMQDGSELTAFQYHQDVFTLPAGASRIATNDVCVNQGFALGGKIIGFQFHPEATESWVRSCANEVDFPRGAHVDDPRKIINGLKYLPAQQDWFRRFLENMHGEIFSK